MSGQSQGFDVNLMQDELAKSGLANPGPDTISLLMSVDGAIETEK